MNWDYVSGFFDADGSITLCSNNKGGKKTLHLSFHNNELIILEELRKFIEKEVGYKGSLSKKKAKKESHSDSYDLKYSYKSALVIANKLKPYHPKKVHRIEVYNKIQEVTPRNGRYNEDLEKRRSELEDLFWKH